MEKGLILPLMYF